MKHGYTARYRPGAGLVTKQRTPKVTIRTVAEQAGVSTATVSRALSGNRLVSPELQLAVKVAAKELGYTGNAVAVALRSARTNTVGMVVPEITTPSMTTLIQEAEEALRASGIQLLLHISHHDLDREREALVALINRRVDGVIICPADSTASRDAVETASRSVPVVQVEAHIDGLDGDWVGTDELTAMGLISEHLASLGVRSAAFAGSDGEDPSSLARRRAFLEQAESAGIAVAPGNVLLGETSVELGRNCLTRLLAAGHLPEALVCASDIIAVGVLQSCNSNNVDVPGDLVVVGHGDIHVAELITPRLTTVRPPSTAKHAVDALRAGQFDAERRSIRLALPPSLVVRESSRLSSVSGE